MLVDYTYYTDTYDGDLVPIEKFDKYSQKAEKKALVRLNGDYTDYLAEIKGAICEIVDILYNQSKIQEKMNSVMAGDNQVLSSEKVGDYSRSYSTTSISDVEKYSSDECIDKQIEEILFDYLFKTGLLYRGIGIV